MNTWKYKCKFVSITNWHWVVLNTLQSTHVNCEPPSCHKSELTFNPLKDVVVIEFLIYPFTTVVKTVPVGKYFRYRVGWNVLHLATIKRAFKKVNTEDRKSTKSDYWNYWQIYDTWNRVNQGFNYDF